MLLERCNFNKVLANHKVAVATHSNQIAYHLCRFALKDFSSIAVAYHGTGIAKCT